MDGALAHPLAQHDFFAAMLNMIAAQEAQLGRLASRLEQLECSVPRNLQIEALEGKVTQIEAQIDDMWRRLQGLLQETAEMDEQLVRVQCILRWNGLFDTRPAGGDAAPIPRQEVRGHRPALR